MNKFLQRELVRMDAIEFHELDNRIQVAKILRNALTRYKLTDEVLCAKLGIPKRKLELYKKGAVDYDLRYLSRLEAMQMECEVDKGRIKIEAQIQFPSYKYSEPVKNNIDL